jgi:hypothetical protein
LIAATLAAIDDRLMPGYIERIVKLNFAAHCCCAALLGLT